MKNCVYRFLNKDNEVIYIGKATDLNGRLSNHNHLSNKCYEETVSIEFVQFETEYEMDLAERYYIPKFNPKYNTVLKDKSINISILEFDNKEWKPFIKEEKKKENRVLKRSVKRERLIIIERIKLEIELLEYKYNIKIRIYNMDLSDVNFDNLKNAINKLDNIVKQKTEENHNCNYNNRTITISNIKI